MQKRNICIMNNNKLTILLLLNKHTINKKVRCLIRCRITYLKKSKEFSIGLFLNPDYWHSKKQKVKPPSANNNDIKKSLSLVTNGDKDLQKLIHQVFGYCIEGGHPRADKFFLFYGSGGNGKSTILSALRKLIGIDNNKVAIMFLTRHPLPSDDIQAEIGNKIRRIAKDKGYREVIIIDSNN